MLIYDVRQVIFKRLQRDRLISNKNKLEGVLRLQQLDHSRPRSSFTTGVPFCTLCHRRHRHGFTFAYFANTFRHFPSTNQNTETILNMYAKVWEFLKLSVSFGSLKNESRTRDLYNLFHRYCKNERTASKYGYDQFYMILK